MKKQNELNDWVQHSGKMIEMFIISIAGIIICILTILLYGYFLR